MQKIYSFFFVLFVLFSIQTSAQNQKYHKAKVFLNTKPNSLIELSKLGICVDHGELKKDMYFISDFSDNEISLIHENNFNLEILIEDVSAYYIKRSQEKSSNDRVRASSCTDGTKNIITPTNFKLGSMGGFLKYSEMIANLDSMYAKFPNLISNKQSIGNSYENRPIYFVKISDNPGINEAEPEVLYNAVHHAREAASLSQVIYYMWYLLENYDSDPIVKNIVDNTQLYFVPCVNPDGYVYNETTNPNGGGMWRKNRKPNGDGTFGTDLNRNYGYSWGFDNTGSSNVKSSDTYRGTAAFSEPETQAMKTFCETHNFAMALNYHTYGNLLIYPWGFQASLFTPDSAIYVDYARLLTKENNYNYGTGDQTVGYVTNGDSDDWMYGEQGSKNKILSMTPEAGEQSDGFWPAQDRIIDICNENISQNLYMALLAGDYVSIKDESVFALGNENEYARYSLERLGMKDGSNYVVSIQPLTNITSTGTSKNYNSLTQFEKVTDSISIQIQPGLQAGDAFSYILKLDNGTFSLTDTVVKIFGNTNVAFADDGNSLNNWNSTSWGNSGVYYSPSFSITDSPNGQYPNNSNSSIVLRNAINLTNTNGALLSFYSKWDLEPGYDYVQVMISTNNGNTWQPLCGNYTKIGNQNQDEGQPLYDGNQPSWVKEEIDLKDYLGNNILISFKLVSDMFSQGDGFYFDDLKVETIDNQTGIKNSPIETLWISQNTPNPATEYTYFNYKIPYTQDNSSIVICNSLGQIVTELPINQTKGSTLFQTDNMQSGIYYYYIKSNNNQSITKKMVIVK